MVPWGGERGFSTEAEVVAPLSLQVRGRCRREGGRRNRDRPLAASVRLVDQPHLSLSNETVIPLALELTWAVSWALIDEPSEPVR